MAFSQTADDIEIPIWISYDGADLVGIKLVHDVKQRFRESELFKYNVFKGEGVVLSFITIDPDKNDPSSKNLVTCYGLALYIQDSLPWKRFFMLHSMSIVGKNSTEEGSIMIYNMIEKEVIEYINLGLLSKNKE